MNGLWIVVQSAVHNQSASIFLFLLGLRPVGGWANNISLAGGGRTLPNMTGIIIVIVEKHP